MKYLLLLAAMSLLACPSPRQSPTPFTVEYRGALRNFMHQGDLSAKASLSDLRDLPHLYALGAAENLKGEIQVFDGKPANSFVSDSRLVIDTAFGKNAALLVWTSVEQWTSVPVPDGVSAYEELETFIEKAARESGIDTKKPFPFLLEGAPAALDWHVIDWPEGDTEHTHEKHRTSGPNGSLHDTAVTILGFYSDSHHAVFTHHSTNLHLHFKTGDGRTAGHVDGLTLGKGMILNLPEV